MEQFNAFHKIVLLGQSYSIYETKKVEIPQPSNPGSIFFASEILSSERQDSAIVQTILKGFEIDEALLEKFSWALIAQSKSGKTWEYPVKKLYLNFSKNGYFSISGPRNESKTMLGMLMDLIPAEKLMEPIKCSSEEPFEIEGNSIECAQVEFLTDASFSGYVEMYQKGAWQNHPFSIHSGFLFLNSWFSDIPILKIPVRNNGKILGNNQGLLMIDDIILRFQNPEAFSLAGTDFKRRALGEFICDFYSHLWFTYRRGIPHPIGGMMTSDAGWGCMIRSGQSMIGEALIRSLLGRKFGLLEGFQDDKVLSSYIFIIEQFLDRPDATFSLHKISQAGFKKCSRAIGEWFAPSVLGHSLASLLASPIRIMMFPDRTIPLSKVKEKPFPVLLLVPARLGIGDRPDPGYYSVIFKCLELGCSVGIVGGLPQRSFYFMGYYANKLIYLDPHFVQDALVESSAAIKSLVSPLFSILRNFIAKNQSWFLLKKSTHQCYLPF